MELIYNGIGTVSALLLRSFQTMQKIFSFKKSACTVLLYLGITKYLILI